MAKRLNLKTAFTVLTAFLVLASGSSCTKDVLRPDELSSNQLIAGRVGGTWAMPRQIITPENVPADVFGSMRLVFTTDEAGNPVKFMAQDCPIIFGNAMEGTWGVTELQDSARVNLKNAGPVDDFKIKVNATSMTISFHMGWENTDTKATGRGTFSATLTRQ
ncbi:hypothetical protein ACSBL2_08745 [Pedobacter sp. AW31-3R]|uniref:hypothetical protein n=1 Tax=Pedobacter sp. AW31-3R TaxID=3445781 RepID=UPI003FA0C4F9